MMWVISEGTPRRPPDQAGDDIQKESEGGEGESHMSIEGQVWFAL